MFMDHDGGALRQSLGLKGLGYEGGAFLRRYKGTQCVHIHLYGRTFFWGFLFLFSPKP